MCVSVFVGLGLVGSVQKKTGHFLSLRFFLFLSFSLSLSLFSFFFFVLPSFSPSTVPSPSPSLFRSIKRAKERRRVSARQQKKILLLLLFTFFRPRLRRQSAPGLKKQNPVFSPSPSRVSFSLFDPSSDARESSRALSEIFHWFSGAKSSAFSSSTKRWRS